MGIQESSQWEGKKLPGGKAESFPVVSDEITQREGRKLHGGLGAIFPVETDKAFRIPVGREDAFR